MFRAVSLEWLEQLVQDNAGTTHSWEVGKEFMNEEDGGGQDGTLTVTPENLEMHRTKRRAAEKAKSGNHVPVTYHEINFEHMYTTDIVECFVRSQSTRVTRKRRTYLSARRRTSYRTRGVAGLWTLWKA